MKDYYEQGLKYSFLVNILVTLYMDNFTDATNNTVFLYFITVCMGLATFKYLWSTK